jgi:hypothetical protein
VRLVQLRDHAGRRIFLSQRRGGRQQRQRLRRRYWQQRGEGTQPHHPAQPELRARSGRREAMQRILTSALLALAAAMTMATAAAAQNVPATVAEHKSTLELAFTYQGTLSDLVSARSSPTPRTTRRTISPSPPASCCGSLKQSAMEAQGTPAPACLALGSPCRGIAPRPHANLFGAKGFYWIHRCCATRGQETRHHRCERQQEGHQAQSHWIPGLHTEQQTADEQG